MAGLPDGQSERHRAVRIDGDLDLEARWPQEPDREVRRWLADSGEISLDGNFGGDAKSIDAVCGQVGAVDVEARLLRPEGYL